MNKLHKELLTHPKWTCSLPCKPHFLQNKTPRIWEQPCNTKFAAASFYPQSIYHSYQWDQSLIMDQVQICPAKYSVWSCSHVVSSPLCGSSAFKDTKMGEKEFTSQWGTEPTAATWVTLGSGHTPNPPPELWQPSENKGAPIKSPQPLFVTQKMKGKRSSALPQPQHLVPSQTNTDNSAFQLY